MLTRAQMHDNRETRRALSGIVQSMLITKHLLFVGFSLQDPNFSELAGAVRRALRPVEGGEAGGADVAADTSFGTLLTLRDRPFLSELWPDIDCLPMEREGDGVGGGRATRSATPSARGSSRSLWTRSLDAVHAAHLLDAKFDGVFSAEEEARELLDFRARLAERPRARLGRLRGGGEALRRLGGRGMPTARRSGRRRRFRIELVSGAVVAELDLLLVPDALRDELLEALVIESSPRRALRVNDATSDDVDFAHATSSRAAAASATCRRRRE